MLSIFPIFSAIQIPNSVRVGLGVVITFLLYRLVPSVPLAANLVDLGFAVVAQVLLGLIVGFVASLVFTGIQFAGEVLDLQIGFAVANVVSPQTQEQVTILGVLELTLASLIYLTSGAHLLLIQGIAGSFHLVPLPYINFDPSVAGNATLFFAHAFVIAMRIAAPASLVVVLVNVALAFMARVAPQMNVFVVGFPMQIGLGLIVLAFSMPLLGYVLPPVFDQVGHQMDTIMRGLRA